MASTVEPRAGAEPLAVVANLDCEARWHGAVLPRRVLERVSAAATLMRYLFDEPIALTTPAPVDAARLVPLPGAPPLTLHHGAPPRAARAGWGAFREAASGKSAPPRDRFALSVPAAIPVARAVNDRRFAAALAERLAVAPPGAAVIHSLDELRAHLASGALGAGQPWICKAPLSAAGRDRVLCSGDSNSTGSGASAGPRAGQVLAGELARALERLLVRFGALVFEPWLERTCDLGVCAVVRADGIEQRAPHTLLTTERGGFLGISQAPPPLSAAQRAQLTRVVEAAGRALRDAGYLGPYNIDAFLYRDRHGGIALRPLCEINARISFGWIAAALADHHALARLGFSPLADVPSGATLLVRPGEHDPIAAWATTEVTTAPAG